ncbi:MAG: hypothetical protein MUO64_21705 [Anaerolineales bacterium]|nr:hypothetical protein [Anaerolineales bacterium]
MQEQNVLTTTRISKTFDIEGYVIDCETLKRVDEISRQAVTSVEGSELEHLQLAYWITTADEEMVKFENIDSLVAHLESEPIEVESISLQYITRDRAGISLVFQPEGEIELSAYSNALDFQFNIDRLTREVQKSDQKYGWFVRTFIFHSRAKRILGFVVLALSWFLLLSIGYYLYALNVGVNIDAALVPSGNSYAKEVEAAIKSEDISRKLNVLLLAQLKGFVNVRDVLRRQEQYVVFSLVVMVIALALWWAFSFVARLYPLSFFEFGGQKKILVELHRKREIWTVAVVIGLIVNVLAGVIVALFARATGFGL